MPTDAKCGLAVGLAVVVAVAILFFRHEPPAAPTQAEMKSRAPAAAVQPPQQPPMRAGRASQP